jgi:hypothetical protein
MTPPRCAKCERPMVLTARFRFDHEPDDSPWIADQLTRFEAAGLQLGAETSVFRCRPCDRAMVTFHYPDMA